MTKKAKIYNGEKTAFSINGVGKNWTNTCEIINLDYFVTPYRKINSKWVKDLDIRPEMIKLLEENIGSTIFDIGL